MNVRMTIRILIWTGISLVLFILVTNIWVIQSTSQNIYTSEEVPFNEVALVLGTSKRTVSGGTNRFFAERMSTAAYLHEIGAVKHILVSGDNGSKYYNEPRDMLKALADLNIPDTVISLDFAGFRTLDSVVRSKEVFGQDAITIVTQEFHCYRSLFIANHFGIKAVAVSAGEGRSIGLNLAVREMLARSFAVLDLYVFQRTPKYLGEEEVLDVN